MSEYLTKECPKCESGDWKQNPTMAQLGGASIMTGFLVAWIPIFGWVAAPIAIVGGFAVLVLSPLGMLAPNSATCKRCGHRFDLHTVKTQARLDAKQVKLDAKQVKLDDAIAAKKDKFEATYGKGFKGYVRRAFRIVWVGTAATVGGFFALCFVAGAFQAFAG